MNYILYDGTVHNDLLPFTFTRPVADIRVGILTIREKWEKFLGTTTTTITEDYLEEKYPMVEFEENVMINAAFCPTPEVVDLVTSLQENQLLYKDDDIVAFYTKQEQEEIDFDKYEWIEIKTELIKIAHVWDIFSKNDVAIRADFELLTEDRISEPIPETVQTLGTENIFIEEGAKLNFCVLNATTGPIYIGKDAEVMEGSVIRGPFALGEGAQVKMAAKIYGATTVGKHSRVGGEISNSVIFGYTNKGHDGFLGNSVLGEWCNLGADTNTSNLKNNYSEVKIYNYETQQLENTALQFCGLMMGDHSKCGINTMFNTGTVVGVFANIFGGGFPPKYIPNFSWGGMKDDNVVYKTDKAIETAKIVMKRRNEQLSEVDLDIIETIFEQTDEWE